MYKIDFIDNLVYLFPHTQPIASGNQMPTNVCRENNFITSPHHTPALNIMLQFLLDMVMHYWPLTSYINKKCRYSIICVHICDIYVHTETYVWIFNSRSVWAREKGLLQGHTLKQ